MYYEKYIDDQWEIEEIWNICEALVKRVKFEDEKWSLRKMILEDIIAHKYYDSYGCGDPMNDLSEKLCITNEEMLAFADILNQYPRYGKKAAKLYRQYGKMDKYVFYLRSHLEKTSEEYVELVRYYSETSNDSEARKVAEQGLKECKDDLTELFIYLLKDAKKCGDVERYKKLYEVQKEGKKWMSVNWKYCSEAMRVLHCVKYQGKGAVLQG